MNTPVDVLATMVGKKVVLELRDGFSLEGTLLAIDENVNISIQVDETVRLVQGSTVIAVGISK